MATAERGFLLGIDIGTYESKGMIVSTDGCPVASHAVPHDLLLPRQGWAEHDAESVWWGDLCTLTKSLLAQSRMDPKDILAIGCSSIAPDMLPVDDAGLPIRNAVLYGIDTRAQAEIRELEDRIGERTIFDRTGNALSAQSVGPKILWLARNEPEVYRRARRFVTGTTFLVGRLTGRWVVDHYTASCMGPLYDPSKGAWAEDLCSGIVETNRLPEIAWTAQIVGGVTRGCPNHRISRGNPRHRRHCGRRSRGPKRRCRGTGPGHADVRLHHVLHPSDGYASAGPPPLVCPLPLS